MNKDAESKIKNLILLSLIISILSIFIFDIGFVLATHVVNGSDGGITFSFNEDVGSVINISLNNSDVLVTSNISEINITIPSSFTFLASSNGTDSSTHTFTNTTTLLSWENSGLVMNKTLQYFWFNVTAATPGVYNLTIVTTNSSSIINTNLTITINDITNPVISLISPVNLESSTTSGYNFTFNVTDINSITNCNLILDGNIINNLTSVNNTGGTNGMYNSSLGVATHIWSVNCTDSSGNVANSSSFTLSVNAAAASSSEPVGSNIYRPSTDQLNKGFKKVVTKGEKVYFKISGETHTFKVEAVTDTNVSISIFSDPNLAVLSMGEEKKLDIINDNYYDISVKLNSILNSAYNPRASFTITTIHEQIIVEDPKEVVVKDKTDYNPEIQTSEDESNENEPSEGEINALKNNLIWLFVFIVLLIFVLAYVGYEKFRNSTKKIKLS
jgi:hypothetical protein